jgi:hypothetical protein
MPVQIQVGPPDAQELGLTETCGLGEHDQHEESIRSRRVEDRGLFVRSERAVLRADVGRSLYESGHVARHQARWNRLLQRQSQRAVGHLDRGRPFPRLQLLADPALHVRGCQLGKLDPARPGTRRRTAISCFCFVCSARPLGSTVP